MDTVFVVVVVFKWDKEKGEGCVEAKEAEKRRDSLCLWKGKENKNLLS